MNLDDIKASPHRRYNPLIGDWVLVSPHRTQRPWQGQVEKAAVPAAVQYDPNCYLCPGNTRAGNAKNPAYESTFVFENDFAALKPDTADVAVDDGRGLIQAGGERGICKVICFSPRHDLTLARMNVADIEKVIAVWAQEYSAIGSRDFINYVQIFENRGEMMGCSNPHPHCQIWANEHVPNEPAREQVHLLKYRERNGKCLLCDYAEFEAGARERIICENEEFLAVVPFWAVWPFESMVLSRKHVTDIASLDARQRSGLADILKQLTVRYDNLFEVSFPYSMGMHQRPTDGSAHDEWHFHAHFYPPLLRSATVRKFMVGYEMFGSPQRDITAESAAERLRTLSNVHYLERI